MKVLQLTTHMNIGGIANYVLSLSSALESYGAEALVASSGGPLVDELARNGIAHKAIDIGTKSELSPKILFSAFAVRRIIRDEGIDIIHAHTRVSQVVALLASRMAGLPYVTTCHGFFKTRLRRVFDTWGARVIAISAPVKGHLEKDLGVAPQRIALIHSGVDTERFGKEVAAGEREMIKRDIGLGPGPVIGTVGRLSDVKGQAVLVEAVAYLEAENRTVQCIIMGDGPEEGNLRRLIRSFGLEKTVHLVRSRPDTAGMLQAMDIFVLPSLKEGLGLSLLEAFASGKACIASDVGGISDIVKDGENGMLFPVGDAKVLGRAIARLLDDEKLRGELGSSAKALAVERFSIGTMAEKTISLYEETLEEYRKT